MQFGIPGAFPGDFNYYCKPILQVSPETELNFKRTSDSTPKQVINILNTSTTTTMAFKVKTTAPKLFAVRPNYGKLGPGESSEIYIAFQVTDSNKQARDDQSFDTKRKDKFLVQSIVIPEMNDQQFQETNRRLMGASKAIKSCIRRNPDWID